MPTLPCENGAGSLNNPNGSPAQTGANNPALAPYVAPTIETGTWEISSLSPDQCAINDQLRQQTYVAETINIAGAPINIFKLLGVHEQSSKNLASQGHLIASISYPGYPISGINTGGSWKSLQVGSQVANTAYVGIDFGIKLLNNSGLPEYGKAQPRWVKVGSIRLKQANTPNEWARQVRVELATGDCQVGVPAFSGDGNGSITVSSLGSNATQGVVTIASVDGLTFEVIATLSDNSFSSLGFATLGQPFYSTTINFTITQGTIPFAAGDIFNIPIDYIWQRVGIFNLTQTDTIQSLNFQSLLNAKAMRIVPTLFSGTGSWEVETLEFIDSTETDINNIQDLFFSENRDRDYALEPVLIKVQYSPADSVSDLSKFGINILDQYSFTTPFSSMIQKLGRPIVVGDIIEVIPEMQYDHNMKPIRKFLEVTDTGWASEGFSTLWKPTVYRFSAQQALPSQETRDIFGTIDTQKYMTADSVLDSVIGEQISTLPLTQTEEIIKESDDLVPEVGSDDRAQAVGVPLPVNSNGQAFISKSTAQNPYIEDGLPPNGLPYKEGFVLPDTATAVDGEYFRFYYPPETKIPARLYRFSALKNRWIYVETDRRGDYSSHKPSIRNILQSPTQQSLSTKTT